MNTFDSHTELTKQQFNDEYFLNNQPVVIKQGVINKQYYNDWSLEYLREKIGTKPVHVNYCERGVYNFNVEGLIQQIKVQFTEACTFFSSDDYINKSYYLQQTPICEIFPELEDELELPEWNLESDVIRQTNLWVGGAGCVTPLHYDHAPNFLVQLRGRKQLTMFSPKDSSYLYPSKKEGGIHLSEIDMEELDIDQHPLFVNAQPYHLILEPGDVLFIPPGWWHHVRSLDMCISVNYWWNRFDIVDSIGMEFMEVDHLKEVVQSFIDNGLDANHKVYNGDPILIKAIRKGYVNIVEALIAKGADVNIKLADGKSALDLAAENGDVNIAKLLLSHGVGDRDSKALNLAKENNHSEIEKMLSAG